MTENPYAPPKAVVKDVAVEEPARVRPRQIKLVVQLAVLSYVIGIVSMAWAWEFYSKLQTLTATIIGQGLTIALLSWIYFKIYQGRNWARIVWLVLAIIGVLMLFPTYSTIAATLPGFSRVTMLIGFVISGVQTWLLFFSPGKYWFRRDQLEPVRTGEYNKIK